MAGPRLRLVRDKGPSSRGSGGYPRVIGSRRRRIVEQRGAAHLGAESAVSARRTEHRDHVRTHASALIADTYTSRRAYVAS